MQSASDEKAILELKTKLAELEQLIGQKQIEVEFYKKMVDMAEDDYDIDIKKTFLHDTQTLLAATKAIPLQHKTDV